MSKDTLARKFHDTYERLAPSFGYETREDTKQFDPESKNGRLMIAVCNEVAGQQEAELLRLTGIIVAQNAELISLRAEVAELELWAE
jgi:hypothetical protein